MIWFVAVVLCLVGVVLAAVTLPVLVYVNVRGGTDAGFNTIGRIRPFAGLFGCSFEYLEKRLRVGPLVGGYRIFSADITWLAGFAREKAAGKRRKSEVKPSKAVEEKPPLLDRLRRGYERFEGVRGYIGRIAGDIKAVVVFRRFDAEVGLGLGNPAATGWIGGVLFALNGILPAHCTIRPVMSFSREVLNGKCEIDITFRSLEFWRRLLKYSPEIYRMLRTRRKKEQVVITQEV